MENLEISHDILLAGADFPSCQQIVERFFARNMLIRYDRVQVRQDESVNGCEKKFQPRLDAGLSANKKILGKFLESLEKEGFIALADLQGLEKGYLSKILHIIAHLQDGFIGIDSRFYNLEEDSHGISKDLQQKIAAAPDKYWILRVRGIIAATAEDSFDALHTFEGGGKHAA